MYLKTLQATALGLTLTAASHFASHGYLAVESSVIEAQNQVIDYLANKAGYSRISGVTGQAEQTEQTVEQVVAEAYALRGLNPQLGLAIMHSESNGDAWAVSPKGAIGVMQIMPANAKACGYKDPGQLFDVRNNATCSAKIMRGLLEKYDIPDALRAYNAGEGNMRKRFKETEAYTHKTMETFINLLTKAAVA